MKQNKAVGGFTLLELLIAIALFTLLATACYRLLATAIQAQGTTAQVWEKLRVYQKARLIIKKDIHQIVARPIRDSRGERQFAFSGGKFDRGKKVLFTFTRSGWHNLLSMPRSDLQRISYVIEADQLVRYYWSVLDIALDAPPVRQVVMEGVENVNVAFLDQKNRWINLWPPASEEQKIRMTLLPAALRIIFTHENYGKIQWWFPGVGMPPKTIKAGTDSESGASEGGDNKKDKASSLESSEEKE